MNPEGFESYLGRSGGFARNGAKMMKEDQEEYSA